MGDKTGISWMDATWNPIRGCSRVSEGCRNCYAETLARRFGGPGMPYEGLVRIWADGKPKAEWNGVVRFVEEHLLDPLRWKKPRRIFVNSMSDLLHPNVSDNMLARIANVMSLAYWHTFQILTKRPEGFGRLTTALEKATEANRIFAVSGGVATKPEFRAIDMRRRDKFEWAYPLPNVWLGVSVEDQATADERIPLLLQTPAAVRFVSAEPLLGRVNIAEWTLSDAGRVCRRELGGYDLPNLDWVICGGESGPGARPMHPDWARSLRDQCAEAAVPFFFKQWGEWRPYERTGRRELVALVNGDCKPYKSDELNKTQVAMQRVGTKAAGHLLDGAEHHAFPEVWG